MKTLSIHHPAPLRRRRGFTLVELLVVIVIIAILAGLAFPAFQGVFESGKKAKAAAMCNQLVTAMQSYNTEYSKWPLSIASDGFINSETRLSDLATMLNGGTDINASSVSTTTHSENPRGIVFLSIAKKDFTRDDDSTAKFPVTPWDGFYYLKFDDNYDNFLTNLPVKGEKPTAGSLGLSAGVAAWAADDNDEVVANSYE